MKCSECAHYDKKEKICLVDSWNDVNNPERDTFCDDAEEDNAIYKKTKTQ